MNNQAIYIGTYGYVVKIDQTTGKELWRTSLPNVGYNPATTYVEDNAVYCGCNGKVFILDVETGKIMATNEMIGLSYGFITFTSKRADKRKNEQQNNQKIQPKPQNKNNNINNNQLINQQPIFFLPPQQPSLIQPQMMQPFLIQPFPQQPNIQQPHPQLLLQPSQSPLIQQPPIQLISSQMMMNQNMLSDPFRIPPQQPLPFQSQQQPQLLQDQQPQNFFSNPLHQLNYPILGNNQHNSFNSNEMFVIDNSNNNINSPLLSQKDILNQFSLTESLKHKQIEEDEMLALSLHQEMNGQQPPQKQQPLQRQQLFFQKSLEKLVCLDNLIFVGLNTSVVAIDKFTGEDVWRSYLGNFAGPLSLTYSDDKILVGVFGNLFCLDALTGQKCWENNLPGLRYHTVSVVTSN